MSRLNGSRDLDLGPGFRGCLVIAGFLLPELMDAFEGAKVVTQF